MTKQISATALAAAAAALISISASTFAAGENLYPFSVNESGEVLTAQQQQYQDEWQAKRQDAQGVAGRPGFSMEGPSAIVEIQTPSRGGPIDD